MKSSKVALLAAAAAALMSLPAHAVVTVFSTSLSGAGEPVPTSTATGSATVSFDNVALTVSVNVNWSELLGTGPFGHIHCCTMTPGVGGADVKIGFGTMTNAASGNYIDTFSPDSSVFDEVLAGALGGKAYVNIHTPGTYSRGEIRGFLAPVPEPKTYALMLGGLGLVGWIARRRQALVAVQA